MVAEDRPHWDGLGPVAGADHEVRYDATLRGLGNQRRREEPVVVHHRVALVICECADDEATDTARWGRVAECQGYPHASARRDVDLRIHSLGAVVDDAAHVTKPQTEILNLFLCDGPLIQLGSGDGLVLDSACTDTVTRERCRIGNSADSKEERQRCGDIRIGQVFADQGEPTFGCVKSEQPVRGTDYGLWV